MGVFFVWAFLVLLGFCFKENAGRCNTRLVRCGTLQMVTVSSHIILLCDLGLCCGLVEQPLYPGESRGALGGAL